MGPPTQTTDLTENTSKVSTYPFSRDFQASVRLYFQHWMWRYQTDFLLHPDIPIQKENLAIADVGCGTGIWVIELARQLSLTTQLDGYDISAAQFPRKEWLPKNVNLQTLDILDQVPEKLVEKYDVIHVGLLVMCVERDDPIPLLRNLLCMLRPGGYIQWDEADGGGIYRVSPDPSILHTYSDKLYAKIYAWFKAQGTTYGWVHKLDELFAQQNLKVLGNYHIPIKNEIAHPWTQMQLMSTSELIRSIDQPPGSALEYWELYEKTVKEYQQGISIRMDMIIVVGQKSGVQK